MKIGIDFDNILSNTTETYINLYNKITNSNYEMKDITDYNMSIFLPINHKKIINDLWLNNELWDNIKPIEDSQKYIEMLSKEHELYIITATNIENANIKYKWIRKNYPYINPKNFIVCNDKQMVNVNIMIDDCIDNLSNSTYKGVLLDYPWNQCKCLDNNIVRVYNWEQIYEVIKRGNNIC